VNYYLAIDLGTHACRTCLFDETGNPVLSQNREISLDRISPHHVEQDAREILDSVRETISVLLDKIPSGQKVIACGIATQRSSVLAWKNDGSVISPVLNWQDTRGTQQLADLLKHKPEIQKISGLPLSAHYGASKLRYLLGTLEKQNMHNSTVHLSPLISYVLFHLLEEQPYIVDHCNAQRTQLFSLADLNWSIRLAELFDVPIKHLPECVPVLSSHEMPHGKLAGTQIPVHAICGDQNAATYGAGITDPHTASVNIGSGAFVLRILDRYRPSEDQLSSINCSDDENVEYIREATINGAGSALSWLEEKLQITELFRQLPVWLEEASHPPVFINTIGGLGSPWWRSDITPVFVASEDSPNDTVSETASKTVAIIESIVFMVCTNLDIFRPELPVSRLRVSGGLSELDGLCQRLADLSALPVERINQPETTARGVAWLAAGKPDSWSDIDIDAFKPGSDPGLNARYILFNKTLSKLLKEK